MHARVAVLAAVLSSLAAAPSTATAAGGYNDYTCKPDRRHPEPVVLVPGTFTSADTNFGYIAPQLVDEGYCTFAITYGTYRGTPATGPIKRSAEQLARFVKRVRRATGAERVAIVGHSQGGMMPRHYLKFLRGTRYVSRLIALAPSNHGTTRANESQRELCPACADQARRSPFLRRLNRGDETPGRVRYTVVQTNKDTTIDPFTSAFLSGPRRYVTNALIQRACPDDETSHSGMAVSSVAYQWIEHALARRKRPADPGFRPVCG